MAASSSARALNAILPQIPTAPYEAQQKARTFASRYVKSGQLDTAIDVLFQSARELLKRGEAGSGIDLGVFMLDVYDTKGEPVSDTSRGRVTQLITLTGPNGNWRKTLVEKSIAWSTKHGEHPAGDPDLHHHVAELYYKEGSYNYAEAHLLASGKRDSGRLLAQVFADWAKVSGTTNYLGNFALRGTIPYLLNGNILAARAFITTFVASSDLTVSTTIPVGSTAEVSITSDSTVNFAQMAVLTCQRAQGEKNKTMREAWVRLCGTYQSRGGTLTNPDVRRALTEIATLYFGFPPPKTQAANPLGDMFSSMFGGPPAAAQAPRRILPPTATTPSTAGLD